jgi:hypothetical protein
MGSAGFTMGDVGGGGGGSSTDLIRLVQADADTSSSGLISGGALSVGAVGTVTVAAGVGRAWDGTKFVRVTWNTFTDYTLPGTGMHYAQIDATGALVITNTGFPVDPFSIINTTTIFLGYFWLISPAVTINILWNNHEWIGNYAARNNKFLGTILGTLVSTGFEVTEQAGPNFLKLNIAAGTLFHKLNEFSYGSQTYFYKLLACSDLVLTKDIVNDNATIDTTLWNDATQPAATALITMTNDFWAKSMVVIGMGGACQYIYPQAEYPTEDAARLAPLPLFSTMWLDGNACLATIVFQKGATTIDTSITDIRPIFSTLLSGMGGASGVISYNDLINKPDHNDLANEQGGQAAERYHLNVAQYNEITAGSYQYTSLMSNYQPVGHYLQGASLSGNNTAGVMAAISTGTLYLAGGNNITLSQNANSITISGPTAGGAQTAISGIAGSAASTVTAGTVQFANLNGISFGLNGSTMTASHNALTTAMASNANTSFVGLNTAATNITWTVNSSGISLSNPGWLTTAMLSNANTSFVGLNSAATNITWTVNSSGISLSNPGWLTTAAQSGHTHGSLPSITGNISVSSGSAAWSISISNYLTTAMVSNANTSFVGLNSAATNITWTVNSSGISLSNPGWLTTAMVSNANTSFVGAGAAFSGVNATGTINSTGITVSVAAPGAAAENNWITLSGNLVGNSSASGSTINWIAGNNITLSGANNSQVRIDAAGGGGGVTFHLYEPFERNNTGTIQSNATLFLSPVSVNQYVTATRAVMIASIAESVNATLSEKATVSVAAIIYTLSNDSIRVQTVSSGSQSYSFNVGSGSSTNSVSFTGYRNFTLPININMTPGLYWFGMWSMTSISAAGATNNSFAITQQGIAPRATAWYANDLSLSNNSASTTCMQLPGHGYVTVTRSNTNLSLPVFIARSTAAGATTNMDVSFASRVPYLVVKDFDFPIHSN